MSGGGDRQSTQRLSGRAEPVSPTAADIGNEYSGPGIDAVQGAAIKNNARAINEQVDGYPVMERSRPHFYNRLWASLPSFRNR